MSTTNIFNLFKKTYNFLSALGFPPVTSNNMMKTILIIATLASLSFAEAGTLRNRVIRDLKEDVRDRREDRRDARHDGGILDKVEDRIDRREDRIDNRTIGVVRPRRVVRGY